MSTLDAFTANADAIVANLAGSLDEVTDLLALGWLHAGTGRSVWKHRRDTDADAEAMAQSHARALLPLRGSRSAHFIRLPDGRMLLLNPMPFATTEVVAGICAQSSEPATHALSIATNNLLRARIGAIIAAGLPGRIDEFPKTDADFLGVIRALRALPDGDLVARLSLGGFADRPASVEGARMRCQECIHYVTSRKWCDLPELPLPVEADWYCRLWKM